MPTLAYVEGATTLGMALVAVLRFDTLQKDLKILSVFFIITVASQATQLYLALHHTNNMFMFHYYTLLEYFAIMMVISMWQRTSIMQQVFRWSIVLYTIVWLFAETKFESPEAFDNFTSSFSSLLFLAASSYTLFTVIDDNKGSLFRNPKFWILSAILMYYAGSLVFFALSNAILFYTRPEIVFAWSLHWGIGILANVFYASGYLCRDLR